MRARLTGVAAADHWQQLDPHLDRALELPPDGRKAYVDALRTTDAAMAVELEGLLHAHDAATAEGFLDQPAPHPVSASRAGQMLGAYRLVAEIGQGGMGNVWLAEREDGRFQRRVAIKFLSLALLGRGGEERFQREGRMLARLTHPHIAQLIDAGVTDAGQPYLVLEHVDGEPIDRYCDKRGLGIEARLGLFLDVLAAVADAHAQLIVHRDLKPSNVLVTVDGGVKLLDFGIARLADDPDAPPAEQHLTRIGGWALTPEYAAPEQVTGGPISTATDVYALGVMLYLLLSGRSPVGISGRAPLDLIRAVVDSAPKSMSESLAEASDRAGAAAIAAARGCTRDGLSARLGGDLETIVRKAMKKEPAERYATVASFADDLRRFLGHQPISARPDSFAYRARKFIRRHRVAMPLACVALAAIAAGIAGTVYQARVARDERDYALRQLSRAEAINDFNHFLLSDAAPRGKPLEVMELLGWAERIARRQSAGSIESRASQLIAIGEQFTTMEEPQRARGVLERARELAMTSRDPSIRARADCALAVALVMSGGLERGRELAQSAIARLPDDPRFTLDRIYCLKDGSYIAREEGSGEAAIARIVEARMLLAAYPHRSEVQELSLLMDLAESYSQAGRHEDAIPAFEQAAGLLTSLGRDRTQKAGTLYNNWALSLDLSGRPRDAAELYRRAIDLSRSDASNSTVSPMLLVNYSRALLSLGLLDDAARYAEEANSLAMESGLDVVVYQSLLRLASIYREKGEIGRSAAALESVEPLLRRELPSGHPAFASLIAQQARTAHASGRTEEALSLIDRACAMAEAAQRRGGEPGFLAHTLMNRAWLRLADGQYAAAGSDARRALEVFDGLLPAGSLNTIRGDAHLVLGRALLGQGKRREGDEALRTSLRHFDDALGPESPASREVRALLDAAERQASRRH